MVTESYDVAIIGAGPIGMACAIEAKNNGLSHTVIDKGCLVNSIYHYPYNMTFFSTSDRLEIGNIPFVSHGNKPTRAEALEYYRRVAQYFDLNTKLYESVKSINESSNKYIISTSKGSYEAKYIIIATGFYDLPYMLNVPGEELSKVKHYYDEPHPYYKQEIIVVGAANSAVDVALETYRKGAKVTMVIRESEISPSVKYWVKPDIENRIKEGSIKAYFNSEITSISEHTVEIQSENQQKITIDNDYVLAMTGYQPDFSFLIETGVQIGNDDNKTPAYDENTMETNVNNIYLAGVICGGLKTNKWFIENSRVHASMILKNIIEKEGKEIKELLYI
ncbi:YpdA family putative bacillithiol disulfide reductase [Marinigracilibium pacificum]|uniref:YpdA family putative bacillithiol disulfide reductase n=1 Tax=Marinigracilibium pacificum TaxID=2729599 RepID=A0A848IVA9_9BACT|nr:YpdA family putative bacillithiol disulfide reductase [Marinigracilibium pacificum]NMM47171.1 YpdA family putative bacillithiol disulfide reductase [Marinigracilibium pacificum]